MQPITLESPDGASAQIYSYGAQLTSWKTADGQEQIYVSENSEYRAGRAIRGGVPIIFPQFDALGPLPRHGFARMTEWEHLETTRTADEIQTTFRLSANDMTRAIWNHRFNAGYTVRLGGNTLSLRLNIFNIGGAPFTFTAALHTYLRVDDIANAKIYGLKNISYRDKTRDNATFIQETEPLTVTRETDRIYENTPALITLTDNTRTIEIQKRGFSDIVIWNPYDRAAALADLSPGGERNFVCIEAAAITQPLTVNPFSHWQGTQIFTNVI